MIHRCRQKNERGQIVVEYILLLLAATAVAALLTKTLVSRDSSSPGIIPRAWDRLNHVIGADMADDAAP